MLPLYLDYLERPTMYEGIYYKEIGVIRGTVTEDAILRIRTKLEAGLSESPVSDYGKKKAQRDAAKAAAKKINPKALAKKTTAAKGNTLSIKQQLANSRNISKGKPNMKAVASHKKGSAAKFLKNKTAAAGASPLR